jgi:Zn-dependent peptidase ImmA (M78 family)
MFAKLWREDPFDLDMFYSLARQFRVSVFVILMRAYELDLLPRQDFLDAYARVEIEMKNARAEQKKTSSGGDFYRGFQTRNGRLLLREVAAAMREGTLLHKEASWLLNTKPGTLENALLEF